MGDKVVAIVEPSKLAFNVLNLLLSPRGVLLRGVHDVASLVPLIGREALNGVIVDSRVVREELNRALEIFCDRKELSDLPKIFLCHSRAGEAKLRATLSKMSKARVMLKPFSPDDLVGRVEGFFTL